jgi:hypothetical protein
MVDRVIAQARSAKLASVDDSILSGGYLRDCPIARPC